MDMTFLDSMKPRAVIITHISSNNDAFGQDGNDEQVYVPRSLVERFPVNVGDVIECKLVRNAPQHADRCPWKAYHIKPQPLQQVSDPYEVIEKEVPVEDVIAAELSRVEMMSTADVADLIGTDTNHVRPILERMHRNGDVVRADIYVQSGQSRPSRCVWALSDIFIPLMPEE
jgi:hypothetical protein